MHENSRARRWADSSSDRAESAASRPERPSRSREAMSYASRSYCDSRPMFDA
jgi:hypothetical protein